MTTWRQLLVWADVTTFMDLQCWSVSYIEENAFISFFAYKNRPSVIIELCECKSETVEQQHQHIALQATIHC